MDVVTLMRDVAVTNPAYVGRTVAQIHEAAAPEMRHGVFLSALRRGRPAGAASAGNLGGER
ncbi:hypothetical protein ACFQU7_13065 [Pseudoroseomonas wenyumeiae]